MKSSKRTTYNMTAGSVEKSAAEAELVWFGQAVQLKDFPEQYSTPNLVKIVQGEYMNLGPKHAKNDSQENELLVYSLETTTKVLCVNLRVKEGRGVIQTENKLSIPLTYEGWFEVLSEDGRRVKPIETIKDLARIFPHTCLVRKPIDALIPLPDGTIRNDSKRTVAVGETMTLFGIVQLSMVGQDGAPVKFLRCLDAQGNHLYFREDQQGLFSPVAGKENISGVHTIKGILNKFHLPVTCKLVHGTYPKNTDKSKFSGIMRIVYVYDEQHAFVCPASGQYRMIPIPAEVPIKVVPAVNFDEIKSSTGISKVLDQCQRMVKCYQNSIHLLYDVDVNPVPKQGVGPKPAEPETEPTNNTENSNDELYDEVEDIYFYVVRHGVAPPPIPKRLYKEGEQDNEFWDEPLYKTVHKPRQRQSIIELSKEDNKTKIFRFYHDDDNQSRPLAYVKTNNEVDKPMALTQTPQKPKLVARRLSDGTPPNTTIKDDKKSRRKSQPAIFRFFFKKDDKKGSGTSSDDSTGVGSGSNDRKAPTKARDKMKNMYL